jgi:ADP-heptose:LPS heptosyltransferase
MHCRLVKGLDLRKTIGVVSHVSLMICNDNGFAHLANAVNVPVVVLFGPTNPDWCSPYNKKKTIIIRKANFEPWFRNDIKVTHPPRGVKSGMEEIEVGDVIGAMKHLMK